MSDHIVIDGGMVRRWQGEDLDLTIPLTSDLIAAAVEADPRIGQYAAGYFAMTAATQTLKPAEPLALAVYRNGWRPAYAAAQRVTNWCTSFAQPCPPHDRSH